MDYYLYLAREQHLRFLEFQKHHEEMSIPEQRKTFFGKQYEAHISAQIVDGIFEWTEYERTKKD